MCMACRIPGPGVTPAMESRPPMNIQQLPMFITFYGLGSVASAVLAYVVASAKHRDASHWATIAFLFPPAGLVTLLLTRASPEHRQSSVIDKKLRKYLDHD